MTLLLNNALEPGFVAVRADGWSVAPLSLGRGGPFPGAVVEALVQDLKSLTRVVVVHGPGSSTGLRIGCAYANALAQVAGAEIAVLPSFELTRLLHPARPDVLAFPQSLGRVVVARRADDGTWNAEDADVPEGAWRYDAGELHITDAALDALLTAATPVEVVIPRYWAPPSIGSRREA